jgi:hypothetical protein
MQGVEPEPEAAVSDDDMPHLQADEKEERPEWLDEKFASGEDLAKSYDELQKKFSQGKHKAPDEYSTDGLTEVGYELDDPIVSTYLAWAKDNGLNQDAFETLPRLIAEMSSESAVQSEADYKTELAALGPNANEIIKSNVQWADSLQRKGVFSEEERSAMNTMGNTAVAQQIFQKLRNATGDMSPIPVAQVADAGMSQDDFDAEIASRMGDPRWGSDPAFTRQTEQMFDKRFG